MKLLPNFIFVWPEVWKNISLSKKRLFYIYILLSVIIMIIDLLSIVSLLNVVGYATNNEIISRDKLNILINLKEYTDKSLFIFLSIFFLSITAISILFKYLHVLVNGMISHGIIYDFNQTIFKKLVYLNLLNNKNININSVTSNFSKIEDIRNVIIYSLSAVSSLLIATGILVILLFIDVNITIFLLLFFLTIYLLIIISIKKKMIKNSKDVSENINRKVHTLSFLMNNMRNVIIDNLQLPFLKNFSEYDFRITKANISLGLISFAPSVTIINLVFIILVGYLFFLITNGYDILTDISKIVAIAFGAQKLNPLVNTIYLSISRSGGSYYNIKSVIDFMRLIKKKSEQDVSKRENDDKLDINKVKFEKKITLKKINFRHNADQTLIENLNLVINKNDKIIILGESGSGKSTFIDILTGLIKPDRGTIKLDNIKIDQNNLKTYQKKISLITQNIFLEEGTLLKNITNTNKKSDIDFKHLKKCCEISEISNFINKNKDKYKMYISHSGNNLSGGQKQRIAIAKALYKNSDILIFDETTSEIDVKIEKKLLNNFSKHLRNKTIILVTHKTQKNNFFNKRLILTGNKLKKIK